MRKRAQSPDRPPADRALARTRYCFRAATLSAVWTAWLVYIALIGLRHPSTCSEFDAAQRSAKCCQRRAPTTSPFTGGTFAQNESGDLREHHHRHRSFRFFSAHAAFSAQLCHPYLDVRLLASAELSRMPQSTLRASSIASFESIAIHARCAPDFDVDCPLRVECKCACAPASYGINWSSW